MSRFIQSPESRVPLSATAAILQADQGAISTDRTVGLPAGPNERESPIRRLCLLTCAFIILLAAGSASAQIYVGTPTTISTNVAGRGGVTVGFNINTEKFSPTTLTVSSGGVIDLLDITAGSTAIDNGGDVGGVAAIDDSLVFSSGNVANAGPSPLPALLQINSGGFASLLCGNGPAVGGNIIINGGQTDSGSPGVPEASFYQAMGLGTLTLNNGQLNGEVDAGIFNARATPDSEAPIVMLNGGTLTNLNGASGGIIAADNASVTLAGTAVSGGATLHHNAIFTMTGGSLALGLAASDDSFANISGGTFNGNINANDRSLVELTTRISGSVFTSGRGELDTSAGASIGGDVNVNNDTPSDIVLDDANIVGSVNVSGPVEVSGAFTVVGGNVTFDANPVPSQEFSSKLDSPVIKGNITLNGFADLTLNGGTVDGFVEANASSSLVVLRTTEIKQPVHLADFSSIDIEGGTLDSSLTVDDDASAEMINGSVQLVNTSGTGIAPTVGFIMEGGTITSNLSVTSNGTAKIIGGTILSDLLIHNSARVTIDGPNANVSGVIRVFDAGSLVFNEGFASGIDIEGGDGLNILGGGTVFRNVDVNSPGNGLTNLEFTSGLIGFDMNIRNGAAVRMSGGEVADDVNVFSSFFTISGGVIDNQLIAHGNAFIEMEGGQVGKPSASAMIAKRLIDPANTTLTPEIILLDQSFLEIDGLDLSDSLLNPNFTGNLSEYSLSGTLENGASLNGLLLFVQNPVGTTPGASFSLVDAPEPATLFTAPLTALLLLLRRRHTRILR